MGTRQLADRDGHRWDASDETETGESGGARRIRFRRDDGTEVVRSSRQGVDELADVQLRALLEGRDPDQVEAGPDTDANVSGGYGDARD